MKPWDPDSQMCASCLLWKRVGIHNGKATGRCVFNPPVVTHFRQALFNPKTTQYEVLEASTTGFPITFADDGCYQHIPDPRKVH